MEANYKNYEHYIKEGWTKEPKEIFQFVNNALSKTIRSDMTKLLDVGCATGELIHFLSLHHPQLQCTGIDVFADLVQRCRELQSDKQFQTASILELPNGFHNQFDIITVVGVMSIFDEDQLSVFFENLFLAAKEKAVIYILSPLNEYGVDCEIKHRKWKNGSHNNWEKGWNIFSKETISQYIAKRCQSFSFEPFKISFDLPKKEDPIRTWTMSTESNPRQLSNGLKLLVDHYLIQINL